MSDRIPAGQQNIPLDGIGLHICAVLMKENLKFKIRGWLTPPASNHRPEYYEAADNEDFKGWRDGTSDQNTLWIYGGPGTGKTSLAAWVIEYIHEMIERQQSHLLVLYFFFNNKANDPHKTQITAILRSLIFQLWRSLGDTPLMTRATEMIRQSPDNGEHEYMTEILQSIFENLSTTMYIVIDAVDECEKPGELITTLRQLNQESHRKLKILLSSRPEQKAALHRKLDLGIEVTPENTMADIELYSRTEVDKAIDDGTLIFGSDQLKHEVVSTLIKGANGMYSSSFTI